MSFLDLVTRIVLQVVASVATPRSVALGVLSGGTARCRGYPRAEATSVPDTASVSPRRGESVAPRLAHAASLASLAACLLASGAAEAVAAAPNQIRVVYEPSRKAAYREIHDAMRERRVLERVGAIVGLVRLPTRLTYRLKGCAGELNAWYAPEDRSVTVCYELLDSIVQIAPRARTRAGVSRHDAIAGPLFQILLHESGHALFDLLRVPILGREEDAADQVASLILLHLAPADARMAVNGGAYFFATSAREEAVDKGAFADVHGLSWQRFYNLACMAYGSAPRRYRYLTARGYLPRERAEGCGEEYEQVAFAFRKLIGPHLRARPAGGQRLRRAFRSAS